MEQPPGIHDSDLLAATPRSARTGPTSTSGGGFDGGTRSAPLLSAAGTLTARTGTSGKSMKTPWYLTWTGIAGLVTALLLAVSTRLSSETELDLSLTRTARRSASAWDSVLDWGLEMMAAPSRMRCKEEPQPQVGDKGCFEEHYSAGATS